MCLQRECGEEEIQELEAALRLITNFDSFDYPRCLDCEDISLKSRNDTGSKCLLTFFAGGKSKYVLHQMFVCSFGHVCFKCAQRNVDIKYFNSN